MFKATFFSFFKTNLAEVSGFVGNCRVLNSRTNSVSPNLRLMNALGISLFAGLFRVLYRGVLDHEEMNAKFNASKDTTTHVVI